MPALNKSRTGCLNPSSGGLLHIDSDKYVLFAGTIRNVLKRGQPLTFTGLVAGIEAELKKNKTGFEGSIGWYAVTVKNDLQARGVIAVFMEGRKKMHRLAK